ncbi:MAG: hypothetical protein K0U98_10460 [Deltaproteobacteria bacterium]|nr:hypothetical protein [Deltaproteobacteria bacterium]
MATYFGVIDGETGNRKGDPATSSPWTASKRSTGKYRVNLDGSRSMPAPVVSVNSDDLTSYQDGVHKLINVSDIGQSSDGYWYFGVIVSDLDGRVVDSGWSFIAEV